MTPQEKQVFSKLFPKTELGTHEIELAVGDEESNKIESIWKDGQKVRSQALKDAISKVDSYTKQMVDLRVKMFKDKEEFSRKYKDLIGESADNTTQVKEWNNKIKVADARINELDGFKNKISQIL
jgi:hypothetical protein